MRLSIPSELFEKLYALDIKPYVSNEQGFDYLKNSYLPLLMARHLPGLQIEYVLNTEGTPLHRMEDGTGYVLPYLVRVEDGYESYPFFFPIMGNPPRYQAIADPDSRQLNDGMARGAVKMVAYTTGLGLSLFTRENELKPEPDKTKLGKKAPKEVLPQLDNLDVDELF